MSQALLEGESTVGFPLMDGHTCCGLLSIGLLVHTAFKSVALVLISGLALPFDPESQLYFFRHHWGSLSTPNASGLTCAWDPINLGILPQWAIPLGP